MVKRGFRLKDNIKMSNKRRKYLIKFKKQILAFSGKIFYIMFDWVLKEMKNLIKKNDCFRIIDNIICDYKNFLDSDLYDEVFEILLLKFNYVEHFYTIYSKCYQLLVDTVIQSESLKKFKKKWHRIFSLLKPLIRFDLYSIIIQNLVNDLVFELHKDTADNFDSMDYDKNFNYTTKMYNMLFTVDDHYGENTKSFIGPFDHDKEDTRIINGLVNKGAEPFGTSKTVDYDMWEGFWKSYMLNEFSKDLDRSSSEQTSKAKSKNFDAMLDILDEQILGKYCYYLENFKDSEYSLESDDLVDDDNSDDSGTNPEDTADKKIDDALEKKMKEEAQMLEIVYDIDPFGDPEQRKLKIQEVCNPVIKFLPNKILCFWNNTDKVIVWDMETKSFDHELEDRLKEEGFESIICEYSNNFEKKTWQNFLEDELVNFSLVKREFVFYSEQLLFAREAEYDLKILVDKCLCRKELQKDYKIWRAFSFKTSIYLLNLKTCILKQVSKGNYLILGEKNIFLTIVEIIDRLFIKSNRIINYEILSSSSIDKPQYIYICTRKRKTDDKKKGEDS